MAAIIVELGHEHTIRRALSLTRNLKDRIVQNFPEKISVSVPGFGAQEFALRGYVKSFLEGVPAPTLKATVAVSGTASNVDAASIEVIDLRVIGTNAGSFSAADAKVSYEFDAEVEPGAYTLADCDGPEGAGQQRSRTFKFIWEIAIEIVPGVSGVYEIDEFEITVATPCCASPRPAAADSEDEEGEEAEAEPDADEEDEDEEEKAPKKSKKKGRKRR